MRHAIAEDKTPKTQNTASVDLTHEQAVDIIVGLAEEVQHGSQRRLIDSALCLILDGRFCIKRDAQAGTTHHEEIIGAITNGQNGVPRDMMQVRKPFKRAFLELGIHDLPHRAPGEQATGIGLEAIRERVVQPEHVAHMVSQKVEAARDDGRGASEGVERGDELMRALREADAALDAVQGGEGQALEEGDALAKGVPKADFAVHGAVGDAHDAVAQAQLGRELVDGLLRDEGGVEIEDGELLLGARGAHGLQDGVGGGLAGREEEMLVQGLDVGQRREGYRGLYCVLGEVARRVEDAVGGGDVVGEIGEGGCGVVGGENCEEVGV